MQLWVLDLSYTKCTCSSDLRGWCVCTPANVVLVLFSSHSFFCVMLSACCRTVRTCCKSTTIAGITIPVGMRIIVPIHAMHHLPEFWHEPGTFRPERYVGQTLKGAHFHVWNGFTQLHVHVRVCLPFTVCCWSTLATVPQWPLPMLLSYMPAMLGGPIVIYSSM